MKTAGFDAVVVAGGHARRLGGVDKPALSVGGLSLLDRVVNACVGATEIVVVGPRRETTRLVRWVREEPVGGGPAAALAAGLRAGNAPWVVALAADHPFLGPEVIHSLWTAARGHDGSVLVDAAGHEQWLIGCYRRTTLEARVAREAAHGTAGLSLRRLLARLDLARLDAVGAAATDCDTWQDVAAARAMAGDRTADPHKRNEASMFDDWLSRAADVLGRPELALTEAQQAAVLDLARDAAHSIARPAAPLTTFLAGYALGVRGELAALAEVTAALSAEAIAHGDQPVQR
jgi:molybdopterin-guanine dinucleotide biosynthesis protein A